MSWKTRKRQQETNTYTGNTYDLQQESKEQISKYVAMRTNIRGKREDKMRTEFFKHDRKNHLNIAFANIKYDNKAMVWKSFSWASVPRSFFHVPVP